MPGLPPARVDGDPGATMRETVRTIADAGGAMTTPDFMAALGITEAAASDRLTPPRRRAGSSGRARGGASGPQVWRVAGPVPG